MNKLSVLLITSININTLKWHYGFHARDGIYMGEQINCSIPSQFLASLAIRAFSLRHHFIWFFQILQWLGFTHPLLNSFIKNCLPQFNDYFSRKVEILNQECKDADLFGKISKCNIFFFLQSLIWSFHRTGTEEECSSSSGGLGK